jgi:putative ABC transport system substrate-binding protein
MRRRAFLALTGGALAWPARARTQPQTGNVYRIGYLGSGDNNQLILEAFHHGLRDLGWVEGQNLVIDYRFAQGQLDRLPALADELVRLDVRLIAASPTPAALAAKNATRTIPIVGISFDNPVQHGLVENLARPGGNVTGLAYSVGPEIFGKDLELLRELIPDVRKIAVLSNPATGLNHALMISNVASAAQALDVELFFVEAREPEAFEGAFATMIERRVGALFVFTDPMFSAHRTRLTDLATRSRLPAMYTNRPLVEAGGLMSYGPSFPEIWRRAASYVDKILKGADPANLPVEQPTKFELVINSKTARVLGLHIPQSLLARADEVIE